MEAKHVTINVLRKKGYYEFRRCDKTFICTCDVNELRETMEEIKQECGPNQHVTFLIK